MQRIFRKEFCKVFRERLEIIKKEEQIEIIQKLMRKGYKLSDIKKVIKENAKENEEY